MKNKSLQTLLKYKLRTLLLVLTLITTSQGVWADYDYVEPINSGLDIQLKVDGASRWIGTFNPSGSNVVNLGTVNEVKVAGFWVKLRKWDNSGTNYCAEIGSANLIWAENNSFSDSHNNNIGNLSEDASGTHYKDYKKLSQDNTWYTYNTPGTYTVYFKCEISGRNCQGYNDCNYCNWSDNAYIYNNGGSYYQVTFNIANNDNYRIAGDGGLSGTTWSTDCSGGSCVLSINSDDPDYPEIPSITFQNQTSGTKRFKVVTCGTWDGAADCNTTHSYSFADGDSWASCDGDNNIGLTLGGTRDVTIAYDGSKVYIRTEVPCTPPTASDFAVSSGATPTYDGSPHQATVVGSVGSPSTYNPTNVVCYYGANSSTTATSQTDAGTYNIYVHSADADGSYCAVTSTITTALATQLVISPVTPSSSNYSDLFSITGTGSHAYTGVAKSVAVAWKSPYTGCTGDITVKYDDSTDAPTNVGVYPITISVAAGTNNNASASDISVGTLTITAISPGLALGDISNKCGTGDYALSSTSNSAGAVTYSVTSGNATIVNGTTLRVNATGDVTVQASQVADGNYTAEEVSETYSFASAPVAGFSASAESSTLNFNNTADVSTTLSTAANSNWDFQWVCDSHPTWGSNNTPTIVSTTSNSTEVRFPIEGVYTFHVGAKCKKDYSYVNSTTVTVTVSLPLCIKGPLTNNTGSWNSYTLISNISNSNTRTYGFTAYNLGKNIREFVLDASPSGDGDNHHIHTSSTVGSLSLTGLDYNSGNNYNLRALEALGISSSGTSVLLTITHNGGLSYNISLVLNCTTPETKDISISESPVCQGESVNVVVESSQDGYIYTVYDSNNSTAGSGTGTGSDLNISVTPSAGTTYTVKAKQADACLETSMANTVDISVNERPSFTPSTGITQYAPVTVTSTALSPSWSIASKDPDVDAAWISTTSGSSTVLKAPTGTYTVSDGGPCPTNAIVVSNDTEICN